MPSFDFSSEQLALIETARKFTKERIIPVAAECDREAKFPKDLFKEAWGLGLVAPNIPEAYGGAGLSELEHCLLTEELGYGCTGIQTSMTANALAATPIVLAGSEEQKKNFKILRGMWLHVWFWFYQNNSRYNGIGKRPDWYSVFMVLEVRS